MIKTLKKIVWKCFAAMDAKLKFPYLKKGDLGIQLGFDMVSPLTSDLFSMHKRTGKEGLVIGIDPDPTNHLLATKIIHEQQLSIQLIQKGTFSKKGSMNFLLGEKSSWNQLGEIPKDSTVNFSGKEISVEIDQLDDILENTGINLQQVKHINITNNGAEYDTLLGMEKILQQIEHLSLTIIAGRHDESGIINGKKDFELILPFLHERGFTTKFKRINQLFWWGFITKLFFNRKWVYSQSNFGVIMACKGNHRLKWYQSFS